MLSPQTGCLHLEHSHVACGLCLSNEFGVSCRLSCTLHADTAAQKPSRKGVEQGSFLDLLSTATDRTTGQKLRDIEIAAQAFTCAIWLSVCRHTCLDAAVA